MPEFHPGQRVTYIFDDNHIPGTVEIANDRMVGVRLDDPFEPFPNMAGKLRAFSPDGRFFPATPEFGYQLGNRYGHIEHRLVEEATDPLKRMLDPSAYPPEPYISYGVFDMNSRVVKPGAGGNTQIGYGIFELPASAAAIVYPDKDDPTLAYYLTMAKTKWEEECLRLDFDAVENKLEYLVGLSLNYTWLYTDQLGSEVRLPRVIDRLQTRHQLVFDFSTDCMITGLHTMAEVQTHIHDHPGVIVTEVEGTKVTLSSGFEFHVTSRYRENQQPKLNPTTSIRKFLLRNLVMQRAMRDSTLTDTVAEPAPAPEAELVAA